MSKRILIIAAMLFLLAVVSPGFAGHEGTTRFPDANPDPRVGTPDDPGFDCNEPDDEDADNCSSVFDEQYNLFGFPPSSTAVSAQYHDPARAGQGQVSGMSVDRAWKITTGQPEVAIAIIDTGIVWSNRELRQKVWLNEDELPEPNGASCSPPAGNPYDCNNDGAVNVADYADDTRVNVSGGPHGVSGAIDGEDLIVAFSDGSDADGNGYIDDIAGWDFFDDDNNAYDASSYASANNHGSGRAEEAGAETDNGEDGAAVCPRCQIMPLRLWDSFVAPADTYAMATLYAADNGADVQEVALGVLQNSRFAQAATQYAFEKGVALMQVSSDLNTANHNYPTNYNNTVYVAGSVADVHGLGFCTDDASQQFDERCEAFVGQMNDFLAQFGIGAGAQTPVQTWFRNSGLTQFGGHAAIVTTAVTGSESTGHAAGAAGLIKSRGLELAASIGGQLTSNEVKQLLTLTAEDVLPENTIGAGIPDPAQPGWDQHFGYGRIDLHAAVALVRPGTIPPEAGIESPAWFAPLDPVTDPDVAIGGFAAANRAESFTYELAYAPGLEPLEETFTVFATGSESDAINGTLGTLPLDQVATLLPGAAQGLPPLDPHQYSFTVRLRVTDNQGNVGEDRKVLFAYHDATLHEGWPKFVDSGGEQSLRFADLDGNGGLEIVAANTSGEINVYNHDGTRASYFKGGQPYLAPVPEFILKHAAAPALASGDVPLSHGGFSTPAVGDLDRDGYPEIVAANTNKVYALSGEGKALPGFPVSINPAFSAPELRTKTNHLKTAIFSSPVLADLDGDGRLDIVVSAMDQRAYAWDMTGDLLPGWPVFLSSGGNGAESINTPAVADITGDGVPEVVVATNEVFDPDFPGGIEEAVREGLLNLAAGAAGDSSRLYAIHHDGTAHDGDATDDGGFVADSDAFLPGWPVALGTLDAELLPLVEPGVDAIIADVDPTVPGPEVINGAFAGDLLAIDDDGSARYAYQSAASGGARLSPGTVVQTAEHYAVGDIAGTGTLSLFKGGVPVEQVVNLLLVGQNVPYQHVIQGWNAASGTYLPGWPRGIEDYQLFMSPAIADVGGGPEREVIQGSGLYLLHAFGPTGLDLPGFPKFTGGWITNTVPVGDIDGDGQLEIATWTREGNMFVWDTTGPACGGNNEWWGFRHDEHNSGFYGNDTRPPSPILDLTYSGGKLRWTAPGEDHACGQAAEYEVRRSRHRITPDNFDRATPVAGAPAPASAGSNESMGIAFSRKSYYYAIRSIDDAGNPGPLSNVLFVRGKDEDEDGVFDVDEENCGGDPLDPALRPERLDTPGDDDGDTIANEPLPVGSLLFDCDGDGWKGSEEMLIFSALTTANDQDPCGSDGWASDLAGSDNVLNIADLNSFLSPPRGDGSFNKFNHPLDDDGDLLIDVAMARWNLQPVVALPTTLIDIGDLNALLAGTMGSPALPPMFGGEQAFFSNGGQCPYPP